MEIKHFLFVAGTDRPSPTGRGSEAEWLRHYKLDAEDNDEVFIPWHRDFVGTPSVGDVLWMKIDKTVVARVVIARIQDDVIGDRLELWFSGSAIQPVNKTETVITSSGIIHADLASLFEK